MDANEWLAISNGVIALAMVGTLIATSRLAKFAKNQVRNLERTVEESAKARKGEIFVEIIKRMNDVRDDSLSIRQLDPKVKWSKTDEAAADRVAVEYERVSFLCLENITEAKYVKGLYPDLFPEVWDKLAVYIERQRKKHPNFRAKFEQFAEECRQDQMNKETVSQ